MSDEVRHIDFSKMSHHERTPLIFVLFTILCLQMGEKSPLQQESIEVSPILLQYVDTVHRKKLPNPASASSGTAKAALQDLLFLAVLQFDIAGASVLFKVTT